ncbi:MAG: glycosyltransferase family 61 protein [Paracoccaceae bacterium]
MPRDAKPDTPPQPALLPDPPLVATATEAAASDGFLLRGGLVDAWFLRRSDILLVTFDNLASVGEYDPPQPWLQIRAANAGMSILGLLASRKDWYRNADIAPLITALREAGLFRQFRRVVFVGASMGGYAALAYSALVPGSVVLSFSPQTSLSRKVAKFDKRYRYGTKKWDWSDLPFADAAPSAPLASEVYVVFDPFVPEDRQHADRITGRHVRQITAGHMGHRAIRQLKPVGVLQSLIEGVARGTFDALTYAEGYRARRGVQAWQKALLEEAKCRNHPRLALRAAEALLRQNPDSRFARRAVDEFRQAAPPPPTPDGPFAGTLLRLQSALVVPEREHDAKLASGVLLVDGTWCKLSRAWIRARKATPAPKLSPDEPITDLPGTHLFAGHFRRHFGHFLVESTARLWALDHIRPPDSILYLPYRGDTAGAETHAGFFKLLGITTPIHLPATALRVENLIVPELGFGWQARYAGSPAYRRFMQTRLQRVPPEGGENLYISRARLKAERGGVLAETAIEENLARAGFDIFHPERHPIEVQIARYRAARRIVALDGSALHLAAYVVAPETRVTMILRRSKANTADYTLQFQSFAGITPQIIDVIRTDWVSADANRSDFQSVGEIDFAALFALLKSLGHLPQDFRPDLPTDAEIAAQLAEYSTKRGKPFRPLTPGERHPEDEA